MLEPEKEDRPIFEHRPIPRRPVEMQKSAEAPFQLSRPNTFRMEFGPTITKQIDELRQSLRVESSRQDVVVTALKILALSRDYELEIESPNSEDRQRVEGLWKGVA
jgi:hypothetical protein